MKQVKSRKILAKRVELWLLLFVFSSALLIGTTAASGQSEEPAYITEVRILTQEALHELNLAIRFSVIAPAAPSTSDIAPSAARILNLLVGENHELFVEDAGIPGGALGGGVIPRLQLVRRTLQPHAEENPRIRNWLIALNNIELFSAFSAEELVRAITEGNDRFARNALLKNIAFLVATRGTHEDALSEGGTRALQQEVDSQ
jgi:hypothetical protein